VITEQVNREHAPVGWKKGLAKLRLDHHVPEEVGPAMRDIIVRNFPAIIDAVHPSYMIEETVSIDEDRELWLKGLPPFFNRQAKTELSSCSPNLSELVDSHKARDNLREYLKQGEEIGLRLLIGHAETQVPIHHNPASNKVEETGYLKIPVVLVISPQYERAYIKYPNWIPLRKTTTIAGEEESL
jgi:hypothetical protein